MFQWAVGPDLEINSIESIKYESGTIQSVRVKRDAKKKTKTFSLVL